MGKRQRKRARASEAHRRATAASPPEPLVRESGLLRGQTDPAMRRVLQSLSESLRARYGG